MGVRLSQGGFTSYRAAHAAGRMALEELLNGLAIEAIS